jgi:hypothetical protein
MPRPLNTGRNPSPGELADAKRVAALPPEVQRTHPAAIQADHSKLGHINTYGALPDYYIDRPFTCRDCGKEEIWRAADQQWYYEEAKGHIDARAVRCHDCRLRARSP